MAFVGPACVAFLVAALVTSLELITSRYPSTYSFIWRSRWFILYLLVYGAISAVVMSALRPLIQSGQVKLEGLGLGDPMAQAGAVGLSIKAFLHIRLFTATVGSQSVPVGVETIVQLFEPWMLGQIQLDEYNAVRTFLGPVAAKYSDLVEVKKRAKDDLPHWLSEAERMALESDIDQKTTVLAVLELYLRRFGKSTFTRVFPAA